MVKRDELKERYEELFTSDDNSVKAAAFDKLAEEFYFGNFGSMSKSDLEVLMFSIYIEQILKQSEEDFSFYSDYALSKQLGITQTRVANLKVKKELRYPYQGFDWKTSFQRILKNARFEDEKIRLHIPDKNLFLELKNAVEESGGYVEMQLNPSLLQISPEDFVALMMVTGAEKSRERVRAELREQLKEKGQNSSFLEQEDEVFELRCSLKKLGAGFCADLIESVFPRFGPPVVNAIRRGIEIAAEEKKRRKSQRRNP